MARAHIVAADTEAVGEGIISELDNQRDTLEHTHSILTETREEISKSQKIINSINRGVIQNKILLYFIIFLENVLLAVLVYWKFFM